uniref:Transposase (Putative), gypsy type n=1 Tax=Tanacetum cinerariifolium TaxID=118510 RepID=A0A6L2N6T9_TANCI|nr:hypothetical protein [Tanacetum cinerariifolium]
MGRDTIQLETAVSTISQEHLLEFTSEYGISEDLHPELPGPEERTVDFSEDMDLFNLISAPNPSKVKTGLRPRAAHEVPLLMAIASRVIDMEDPDVATESSGTPFAIEKSPLDFDNENPSPPMIEEVSLEEEVAAMGPRLSKKRRRRVNDGAYTNAPPKVLRKDYASVRPEQSTHRGKTLPTMGLAANSTFVTPADTKGVFRDSYQKCGYHGSARHALCEKCRVREIDLFPIHGWVARRYLSARMGRDQQLPLGHPRRMLRCCRSHSTAGVAIGSQLRLRFEQEVRLLKKARAQIARQDQRIQVREEEIKKLDQEVQVTGEERIKAAFEEFKKHEDDRVEKRCAEMDALLDALSINFDEELYPHMLTVIAGHQWVIGHGLRLAVMKSDTWHRAWEGRSRLGGCGAYDPEANNKYLQALQELKDLKYPIVDQLKGLKDAPIEVIMASLHLESDSGDDAPKWIRDLRPSTSQLKIHVYPEVRDPRNPWAVKEDTLLEEAIADNVSRAKKKKKCRVVCHTHGVDSAHHARSDGVPVSVPTVASQGLAILLADTATQT